MNLHSLSALAFSSLLVACSSADVVETGGDVTAARCDPAAASGIEVAATDVHGGPPYALGYPPYAIDGCLLVYVAAPSDSANAGSLLLRDLASGEESVLAPSSEEPRRPAIAGSLITWEATIDGRSAVRVRSGESSETVAGPFDHAGEPRAAEDGVVLTAWLTADPLGDTDIFLHKPGGGAAVPIATGPAQQRFPDISRTHIVFTDFIEDPDGRFDQNADDLADIAVHDRAMGTTSPRPRVGKQAFPILGADGKVGYLDWDPDHPEPKFSAYGLVIGDLGAPPADDVALAHIVTLMPYIRPTARSRLVEWVDWPLGAEASLMRRPADASEPAALVPGVSNQEQELFGPCASSTMTVIATRMAGGAMILRGVERPSL